jgi:hypothetical protein
LLGCPVRMLRSLIWCALQAQSCSPISFCSSLLHAGGVRAAPAQQSRRGKQLGCFANCSGTLCTRLLPCLAVCLLTHLRSLVLVVAHQLNLGEILHTTAFSSAQSLQQSQSYSSSQVCCTVLRLPLSSCCPTAFVTCECHHPARRLLSRVKFFMLSPFTAQFTPSPLRAACLEFTLRRHRVLSGLRGFASQLPLAQVMCDSAALRLFC